MAKAKPTKRKNNKTDASEIASKVHEKIFWSTTISSGAKILYGMIYYLYTLPSGFCNAGTGYLAMQMGRTKRSVQLYIKELLENKYIKVRIEKGTRYITPLILEDPEKNGRDIVSFIPGEILRHKKIVKLSDGGSKVIYDNAYSSEFKLRYGYISYKTANKNGYYEVQSIAALANELNVSTSTIYRDLKIALRNNRASYKRTDYTVQIKTFNSYQDNFKKKKRIIDNLSKYSSPPDKQTNAEIANEKSESNLTPEQINYWQKLIFGQTI